MEIRYWFLLILLGAIWGSAFIFIKIAAPEFGAIALVQARLLIASSIFIPILLRRKYLDQLKDHILAIESDAGVFKPKGFGFTGPDESLNILQDIGTLLKPIQSEVITKGGGGADIGPIMAEGVPGMGLTVESEKYFWYHHTAADTWDKLNIHEFNQCVATMAIMSFVVADMDIRLPK